MGSRGILVVCIVALCISSVAAQWYPRVGDIDDFIGQPGFVNSLLHSSGQASASSFVRLRRQLIDTIRTKATNWLQENNIDPAANAEKYPYFHWIPIYKVAARPDGPTVTWEGQCFKNNTAKATTNANGTISIVVTRSHQTALFCSDMYLLGTASGIKLEIFSTTGSTTVLWVPHNDSTPGEVWDIKYKGIRFCMFLDDLGQTISNVLATVNLFLSELTVGVPDEVAKANVDFMEKYAVKKMLPRTVQEVPIDPKLVKSGDFFGVIRLDGLDTMLAWAMGSTTGHTTVALWIDGELYITESTVDDTYWPTNGIQKTKFDVWMKQAKAADYQVVWAPLNAEAAAKFNVTAAVAKFKELEGLDYGYHNMLMSWIDTVKDNYPCVPPNWSQCLQWEHVEMLLNWADRAAPAIGTLLWDEAVNIRMGTTGLRIADVWLLANQRGIPANTIPGMVEQDSWNYHTLRNGQPVVDKSMVCCVYVCNIWKAAGVFSDIGNNFNCGEMTNWDDYSLSIFDNKTPRPSQCQSADPSNPTCQLEGKYTLVLNDYSSHKAYPHMAERCPSLPPDYKKPSDC